MGRFLCWFDVCRIYFCIDRINDLRNLDKIKFIPIDELVVGEAYELHARNLRIGIWDGYAFNGIRTKFGDRFMDNEVHWDLDEHIGTANAIRKLT